MVAEHINNNLAEAADTLPPCFERTWSAGESGEAAGASTSSTPAVCDMLQSALLLLLKRRRAAGELCVRACRRRAPPSAAEVLEGGKKHESATTSSSVLCDRLWELAACGCACSAATGGQFDCSIGAGACRCSTGPAVRYTDGGCMVGWVPSWVQAPEGTCAYKRRGLTDTTLLQARRARAGEPLPEPLIAEGSNRAGLTDAVPQSDKQAPPRHCRASAVPALRCPDSVDKPINLRGPS